MKKLTEDFFETDEKMGDETEMVVNSTDKNNTLTDEEIKNIHKIVFDIYSHVNEMEDYQIENYKKLTEKYLNRIETEPISEEQKQKLTRILSFLKDSLENNDKVSSHVQSKRN